MELKPCPFCGAKSVAGMVSHSNECFIHKLIYMHPAGEVEKAWQIRAADPLLKEMAEYIHDLLTKVARYGYDFQLEAEFEEGKVIMQKYHEQEGSSE